MVVTCNENNEVGLVMVEIILYTPYLCKRLSKLIELSKQHLYSIIIDVTDWNGHRVALPQEFLPDPFHVLQKEGKG